MSLEVRHLAVLFVTFLSPLHLGQISELCVDEAAISEARLRLIIWLRPLFRLVALIISRAYLRYLIKVHIGFEWDLTCQVQGTLD